MALPVDLRELVHAGSRFDEERERPVRLMLLVEADVPDALLDVVESAFWPETDAAALRVRMVGADEETVVYPGADAVLLLAGGGGASLTDAAIAARGLAVPVAVVALGDEAAQAALATALMHASDDVVARPDADTALAALGLWLAERLPDKRLALARNYAFMRTAVAEDAIRVTATQNGIIGAAAFIPGADMPIMTANQAKMLLQIAAAYGQPLGTERVKELVAVVGGGFALRGLARQVLGFVPIGGWIVKAGIGYAGTVAMGKAALAYFESGGDLASMRRRMASARAGRRAALPPAPNAPEDEGTTGA